MPTQVWLTGGNGADMVPHEIGTLCIIICKWASRGDNLGTTDESKYDDNDETDDDSDD